jgi:hypothetical protein
MSAVVQGLQNVRSRFFPTIALALALVIIVGFSRTYYLRFLSDLPPLKTLLQLHGLVFTAWLVLFFTQTRLVAAHRVDLHMKLGIAGVGLAILVVAVGVATVFAGASSPRIHASGLTSPQFSIVGLVSIAQFAVPVTLGVALRRRSELHKRFMVLAMIGVLGPPTGRLIGMLQLGAYALVVQMIVIAAFVTWCLVWDWRRNRIVHPIFAIGGLAMVLLWPARYAVARSDAWQPIGEWIARVGA